MKKQYYNYKNLKAWMLFMLMSVFALGAYAQGSIDGFSTLPPDVPYFFNDDTDASVELTTSGTFADGTIFYLHTGNSGTDFTMDDVLVSVTDEADALDFIWSVVGNNVPHFVSAATGDFDSEEIEIGSSASIAAGSYDVFNDEYDMNLVGERKITTQAFDLSSTEEIILFVSLDVTSVDENRPIRVQFSTNGTDWTNMTDEDDSENQWSNTSADLTPDLRFVLTSGQKSTTTQFRIIQEGKSDFVVSEEPWTLDATNFDIVIGGLNVESSLLVGNYDIFYPTTQITAFNDDNETPATYYAGMDVEVEGLFTGATDQVDDYEYTAVFENGDTRFLLESSAGVNNANDLSITGTIPAGIEYDLNWTVTIRVYTGATPTLGVEENLLPGLDRTGYGGSDFNADGDRHAISEAIDIQSTTNAQISIDLEKTSDGLSPSGTELQLEYTTDGVDFDPIGDPISLNADLSEALVFDLSSESGIISSSTQFQIRQISNNGLDLDTWEIQAFDVFAGGNILFDQEEVDYFGSSKDVFAPVIALDPVEVPDELIFPGDEVVLTYNIIEGAFPAGTEIHAVFDGGAFDYLVGTSTSITPGDDQDHPVTITVPPVEADLTGYTVSLVAGTGAESNDIIVPVYNVDIDILEVASDNGVFDGTTDVIYPGDQITVTYTLDGSVGAGGELFLEVLDYGDPMDADDDVYVVLNSATGAAIDGDISGDLPTNINYDDPGPAEVRLRVGNGLLADMSEVFAQFDDSDNLDFDGDLIEDVNSISIGDFGVFNIESFFDVESFVGNDPNDIDDFIGSGERSFNTVPYEMPFGGTISIVLAEQDGSFEEVQTVMLQASNDGGTSFTTIAEEDFEGGFVTFDGAVALPESLWGESVVFKVMYNADGASDEFENTLDINTLTVTFNDFVTANSETFDISGQFRRPRVTLEILDDTDYVTGESVVVEYTTEGVFPANTAFALLFTGNLNDDGTDPADFDDVNYDDGDDFATVVATSSDEGLGSFTFTVPDMAFEGDGSNTDLDLYDFLEVIAYDATGGADFLPNEEVDIDEDEDFLVIEGTNEEDGAYTFDLEGDRSLLTQAYDISSADQVYIAFTFSDVGILVTDNPLTIPQLQVSIDAGASFQNIPVDDESLIGDGYLFNDDNYEVMVPAEFVTNATHFRWYQALNLGVNQDVWSVSAIKIILVNGNEITEFYEVVNDMQGLSVSHPAIDEYELAQVDPTDAVFNGETVDLTLDKVYETTVDFPAAAGFTYLLFDPDMGDYVMDPDTDEPLVLGSSDDIGVFTATIPFFITNNTYQIHLVVSKSTEEGTYYYVGDSDGGLNVGLLDVFLRVIRTTFDFDENDVFYAGNTATFTLTLENDETNLEGVDNLFANLLVKDFDGGDLILATQQGLADITVDLFPWLRGEEFEFVVEISEDAPLGNVGDIIGDSDLENIEDDYSDNIFFPSTPGYQTLESRNFFDSEFPNQGLAFYFNLFVDNKGNQSLYLEQSINGAAYTVLANFGTGDWNGTFFGYGLPTELENGGANEFISYRFRFSGDMVDGSSFRVVDPYFSAGPTIDVMNDFTPDALLIFDNEIGRGLITTREFEAGELENVSLISFDLTFDEVAENVVDNQFLIFEYSTDGGATFSSISTFPEVDEEEAIINENYVIPVTDDMRDNNTIFRFRQEERNSITVVINNFSFLFGGVLPFDYVSDDQVITNQTVLVTSISTEESCQEGTYTLGYEVRGRMDVENEVNVFYESTDGSSSGTLETEFNVTSGTGTADISLDGENLFTTYDNNKTFRFRFDYDDETNEDYDYEGQGVISEQLVEIVAPIYESAGWSTSGDVLSCDPEDVSVFINDPQNYFMYEVFNTEDNAVLGSLVYDPEEGDTEIDLGPFAATTNLGLRISAMSATGNTSCDVFISDSENEVEILADFTLFSNLGGAGSFREVGAGESVTICNSGSTEILRVQRLLDDGSFTTSGFNEIEWFLNDVNNPINVGNSISLNEIDVSGSYFAQVTTGNCIYTTQSITLTIIDQLDQPTVDVTGNTIGCESEDPITLSVATGTFWLWNTGETTQSIIVEESGSYNVIVSDAPIGLGCASVASADVVVDRYPVPASLSLVSSTTLTDGLSTNEGIEGVERLGANAVVESCEEVTIYFFEDELYNNTNYSSFRSINVTRDGAAFATVESPTFQITESGVYSFEWENNNPNVTCTVSSVEITVTIVDVIEDAPVLTTTDPLDICFEESVILTAPAGFPYIVWYRNGSVISSNQDGFVASGNTLEVFTSGTYNVAVGNAANCLSPQSNGLTVNVRNLANDTNVGFFQSDASCGAGVQTFELTNTNSNLLYQLVDAFTETPVGVVAQGTDGPSLFLETPSIDEPTVFYFQVSYADGSGCPNDLEFEDTEATPNNVMLELEGNTIVATVYAFSDDIYGSSFDIRWFRNGVELRNRLNNSSIQVLDVAEYSVEVEFESGCIITSNAVAIESQPEGRVTYFGEKSVNMYPNPSTDVVNVSLNGGPLGKYKLSIMSLSGQVVISKEIEKTSEEHVESLDIQSLEKGIYNLQIVRGNKVENYRIVKQ